MTDPKKKRTYRKTGNWKAGGVCNMRGLKRNAHAKEQRRIKAHNRPRLERRGDRAINDIAGLFAE